MTAAASTIPTASLTVVLGALSAVEQVHAEWSDEVVAAITRHDLQKLRGLPAF